MSVNMGTGQMGGKPSEEFLFEVPCNDLDVAGFYMRKSTDIEHRGFSGDVFELDWASFGPPET